jgi:hypothetical protein
MADEHQSFAEACAESALAAKEHAKASAPNSARWRRQRLSRRCVKPSRKRLATRSSHRL